MLPMSQNLFHELPELLLQHHTVILQAPTGSGKTTQVPRQLLQHLPDSQKILMLEPRRLAARSVAHYMARCLGERVGQTIGYRVKLDTQVSAQTRLEIVTEGILLRFLQTDPALSDYAMVIFDEFHERSVQADLGLALARQSQALFREDLKLIIMSATLNTEALAQLLQAPVLTVSGRQFPVSIQHKAPPAHAQRGFSAAFVAENIQAALKAESGSLLVFLPGSGEIRQVQSALVHHLPENTFLAPLYGSLSAQAQDQAILPAPTGQRKVVLATNIAETSLTIEGIRVVIDAGLERRPQFDHHSGMTRLVLGQIALSSAEQRAGRAGRTEPGVCWRLWSSADNARMSPQQAPEILQCDLAALALALAQWGTPNPEDLEWLTPPPMQAYTQAQALLQSLEAVNAKGQITPHGQAMAEIPVSPRLAHMLLKAQTQKLGSLACYVATLLSERDILPQLRQSDLQRRLEALHKQPQHFQWIHKSAKHLGQALQITVSPQVLRNSEQLSELGYLVALAYPDRIAQHRPGPTPRFLLSGGRGACLPEQDSLADTPYLAVADLDGHPREAKIYLAAPLSLLQLEQLTAAHCETRLKVDTSTGKVRLFTCEDYGALTLKQERIREPDPQQLQEALCQLIAQQGLQVLPWDTPQTQWLARVAFAHRQAPEQWPELDQTYLKQHLRDWLGPFLTGLNAAADISTDTLQQALDYLLGYEKTQTLDRWAPTHLEVPSGNRIRLDYTQGDIPVLPVRLQEVFGMEETPQIYQGKVMVMMHLLSPARRPIQVTQDLRSFWQNTYHDVKKELKGRYPKHYWPEDPLQAEATSRIKPRKP